MKFQTKTIKFKQNIKNLFIISGLIFFFSLTAYILFGPFFKISELELVMDKELKASKSYRQKKESLLAYLESYKGQYLWTVDLKKLVEQTNTLYPGSTASVIRKFPKFLIIFLKKKDTAVLLFHNRNFFSLSYQGDIGHKKHFEDSFDLPILRGDIFWKKKELRKKTLNILASIPKTGPFLSVQNISEILYNKTNDSLLFYLIRDYFILELSEPISAKKAKNILFVLKYLNQKNEEKVWIDARPNKKIIVKRLH